MLCLAYPTDPTDFSGKLVNIELKGLYLKCNTTEGGLQTDRP